MPTKKCCSSESYLQSDADRMLNIDAAFQTRMIGVSGADELHDVSVDVRYNMAIGFANYAIPAAVCLRRSDSR
jgi:hypothetical protein